MIRFTTLSLFSLLLLRQRVAALVSEGADKHAGGVLEAPPCEMWPSLLDRFALVHSVSVSVWPRAPQITFSSVLFPPPLFMRREQDCSKRAGKERLVRLVRLVSEPIKKLVFKGNNIGFGSRSSMQTFTCSCSATFSKNQDRLCGRMEWNAGFYRPL